MLEQIDHFIHPRVTHNELQLQTHFIGEKQME